MRRGFLVHHHNFNERTENNILSFLKKRIKETTSREIRNENKSFNFFGWNFFFSKDIHNGIIYYQHDRK